MPVQSTQVFANTAAEWTTDNTFLPPGYIGIETDTGRMKLGANDKSWSQLAYYDNGVSREGLVMTRTITAIGTTGAQTINKPAGTINVAAAGTSVILTNSLITVNSIVLAVIRTADTTATFIKSVVPAAGSCTITLNAAATATVSLGFHVIN